MLSLLTYSMDGQKAFGYGEDATKDWYLQKRSYFQVADYESTLRSFLNFLFLVDRNGILWSCPRNYWRHSIDYRVCGRRWNGREIRSSIRAKASDSFLYTAKLEIDTAMRLIILRSVFDCLNFGTFSSVSLVGRFWAAVVNGGLSRKWWLWQYRLACKVHQITVALFLGSRCGLICSPLLPRLPCSCQAVAVRERPHRGAEDQSDRTLAFGLGTD